MKWILCFLGIIYILYNAFPGWIAIWATWKGGKNFLDIWIYSILLFVFSVGLICFMYWFVIFSEPWDTNGLVTMSAFAIIPILTWVVTVPLGFLLRWYAIRKKAWPDE